MIGDIVIRKNVFETNSSSMHSITLADADGVMDMLPLDKDNITLTIDCEYDFQWGKEIYTDANAKIAYCIADNLNIEMLEEAIKSQTGANVLKYEGEGSLDHQSTGTAQAKLQTVEDIQNFIFNPNCELIIDNDNH